MATRPVAEAPPAGERRRSPRARLVWSWNRRLHFYSGLYFLLFIWLFSVSGLVLNHGRWPFADFWSEREESTSVRAIAAPGATGDLALARELMGQLGLAGEVASTRRRPESGEFEFQVTRPGLTTTVVADLPARRAEVRQIRVNAWGVMSALHHFTGVSMDDPARQRDWWLTRLWSFSMDAVAVGLIVMVLSGVYLWSRLRGKLRLGLLMLAVGTLGCAFFVYGLAAVP